MEGHLRMSAKERERLKIFERVKRGELQQKGAAVLCQLEYRYLRRLYRRTASSAVSCNRRERRCCVNSSIDTCDGSTDVLQARRSGLGASRTWPAVEPGV